MWQDVQTQQTPGATRIMKTRAAKKAAKIENILRLEIANDKKKADTLVEVCISFHVPMYVYTCIPLGTLGALIFRVYCYTVFKYICC